MPGIIEHWNTLLNAWFASLGGPVEGIARLTLAALFGGLVGMERELRGRQAGFRTYLLVCVGSALVMLVSVQFAYHPWIAHSRNQGININIDPARIAYGVMTGIGFLGAGVIVHNGGGVVRGLTTAAGLWCVAAIGLAVGFGMYFIALVTAVLVLTVLWILDYIEELLPRRHHRVVTVRTKYAVGSVQQVADAFQAAGLNVQEISFDRSNDLADIDIHLRVAFTDNEHYNVFERKIEADPAYSLMSTREI